MNKLVIQNARVFSPRNMMLSARPMTVVCQGGQIVSLEPSRVKAAPVLGDRSLDLKGAILMPGFCDGHTHFADWALCSFGLGYVNLRVAGNAEQIIAEVKKQAEQQASGTWVQGGGWYKFMFDGAFPTAQHLSALDAATGDHPVALKSGDYHNLWVNSAALKLAGIGRTTNNLTGGEIKLDPATGQLTGVLLETATKFITGDQKLGLPSILPAIPEEKRITANLAGMERMHSYGITSTCSFGVSFGDVNGPTEYVDHENLLSLGQLSLRIRMGFQFENIDFADQHSVNNNDLLQVWGIKFISDGTQGSQTALMFDPYENLKPDISKPFGEESIPFAELVRDVRESASHGYPVAIHAIGDRANANAIAAINAGLAINPALRSRVEHSQIINASIPGQLAESGIVASMQPCHLPGDVGSSLTYLGKRAKFVHAHGQFLDAGVMLAFGSDAPIEDPNPMLSLYAALARQGQLNGTNVALCPENAISLPEALRAFTWGNAYAVGREDVEGDVAPGYLADLVVLPADFFARTAEDIRDTSPLYTIFNGQIVFSG